MNRGGRVARLPAGATRHPRAVPPCGLRRQATPGLHGRGTHLGPGPLSQRGRVRQPAVPRCGDEALKLLCVAPTTTSWPSGARPTPPAYWRHGHAVLGHRRHGRRGRARCARSGCAASSSPGSPSASALPTLGVGPLGPRYRAAADAGLPIHFHIGGGEDDLKRWSTRSASEAHGNAGTQAYAATNLFLKNGVQCADLITSGVLARLERLRFVSVESGIGWIPFVLESRRLQLPRGVKADRQGGGLLPSELFRRQVYAPSGSSGSPPRLLDEMPMDNLLFETDFPHVTCLYGNIPERSTPGCPAPRRRSGTSCCGATRPTSTAFLMRPPTGWPGPRPEHPWTR